MIKQKSISFVISKITTEQFAIIEENYSKDGSATLGTNLRFGAVPDQKTIAFFAAFTFESDKKPFIIIEAGCHFNIQQEAWTEMINDETKSLTIPKGFLNHLAMLTIGATRGILHAKTENTSFNTFVVPAINLSDLIHEDAVISLIK
jgi:hypothetical protein